MRQRAWIIWKAENKQSAGAKAGRGVEKGGEVESLRKEIGDQIKHNYNMLMTVWEVILVLLRDRNDEGSLPN